MLFILWFKFDPDHTERVREMWKQFKYPEAVKLIGRYVLIGRHISVAIFDAPDEVALLKVTGPFSSLGVAHVAPAMPLEEALKYRGKKRKVLHPSLMRLHCVKAAEMEPSVVTHAQALKMR